MLHIRHWNIIWTLVVFSLFEPASAALPKHNPVPGGVAVVALNIPSPEKPSAKFGNREVLVINKNALWFALVGLSCDILPGNYIVSAHDPQLEPIILDFAVHPLPPAVVNGGKQSSAARNQVYQVPEQIDNLDLINPAINERYIVSSKSDNATSADYSFSSIVESYYLVPYGKIIHKGKLKTHNYVSFLGKPELSVYSPSTAIVLNVSNSDSSGFTVQLDHGNGIISILGHLKTVLVEAGQLLDQGELVGITRRMDDIKGSKLDWGVSLNGSLINPLQFTSAP